MVRVDLGDHSSALANVSPILANASGRAGRSILNRGDRFPAFGRYCRPIWRKRLRILARGPGHARWRLRRRCHGALTMPTSPAPDAAAPPGMCPGVVVLGGGGRSGGDGEGDGGDGSGGGGGNGEGAGEDGRQPAGQLTEETDARTPGESAHPAPLRRLDPAASRVADARPASHHGASSIPIVKRYCWYTNGVAASCGAATARLIGSTTM